VKIEGGLYYLVQTMLQLQFLHVDEMARACLHVMNLPKECFEQSTEPMCSHINVGGGSDFD
jgi:GDP-L-fucose synthase